MIISIALYYVIYLFLKERTKFTVNKEPTKEIRHHRLPEPTTKLFWRIHKIAETGVVTTAKKTHLP